MTTKQYLGQIIYIVYDGEVISFPTVNAVISNGVASISGMEDYEAADYLATHIRIGALPVELKELRSQIVGAKLGQDAIDTTLLAGAIGLGMVCIIMIVIYLFQGVVATLALIAYVLLMLLALNGFNVTLTLPGLAGIILSIGMAVDANVIIYTRIKEEIGKALNSLSGNGHRLERRIYAKDINTKGDIPIYIALVEAILHPSRSEDSQAEAVGNVVDGR